MGKQESQNNITLTKLFFFMAQPAFWGVCLISQYFDIFNAYDWVELPGSSRMLILQPRGGSFCNHEEENFATSRRSKIQGISRVGGLASLWMLNCQVFFNNLPLLFGQVGWIIARDLIVSVVLIWSVFCI